MLYPTCMFPRRTDAAGDSRDKEAPNNALPNGDVALRVQNELQELPFGHVPSPQATSLP
jgi:hypothetical protein